MHGKGPDEDDDFLSLSVAARLLGVHPSTVRVWADQGRIPVYRTQGGHRRFRRSEVHLWKQSRLDGEALTAEGLLQQVLAGIRLQVSEANLQEESWYAGLDSASRERYRQRGRALSEGLAAYLASDALRGEAQACAIGRDYALLGQHSGLSRMEAVQAFLFFHGALLDALLRTDADVASASPPAWGDLLRKTDCFTDQILVALLESYEKP